MSCVDPKNQILEMALQRRQLPDRPANQVVDHSNDCVQQALSLCSKLQMEWLRGRDRFFRPEICDDDASCIVVMLAALTSQRQRDPKLRVLLLLAAASAVDLCDRKWGKCDIMQALWQRVCDAFRDWSELRTDDDKIDAFVNAAQVLIDVPLMLLVGVSTADCEATLQYLGWGLRLWNWKESQYHLLVQEAAKMNRKFVIAPSDLLLRLMLGDVNSSVERRCELINNLRELPIAVGKKGRKPVDIYTNWQNLLVSVNQLGLEQAIDKAKQGDIPKTIIVLPAVCQKRKDDRELSMSMAKKPKHDGAVVDREQDDDGNVASASVNATDGAQSVVEAASNGNSTTGESNEGVDSDDIATVSGNGVLPGAASSHGDDGVAQPSGGDSAEAALVDNEVYDDEDDEGESIGSLDDEVNAMVAARRTGSLNDVISKSNDRADAQIDALCAHIERDSRETIRRQYYFRNEGDERVAFTTDDEGNIGSLHSYLDRPAYVRESGELRWYKNGVQHRDAELGPALVEPDRTTNDSTYFRAYAIENSNVRPFEVSSEGEMRKLISWCQHHWERNFSLSVPQKQWPQYRFHSFSTEENEDEDEGEENNGDDDDAVALSDNVSTNDDGAQPVVGAASNDNSATAEANKDATPPTNDVMDCDTQLPNDFGDGSSQVDDQSVNDVGDGGMANAPQPSDDRESLLELFTSRATKLAIDDLSNDVIRDQMHQCLRSASDVFQQTPTDSVVDAVGYIDLIHVAAALHRPDLIDAIKQHWPPHQCSDDDRELFAGIAALLPRDTGKWSENTKEIATMLLEYRGNAPDCNYLKKNVRQYNRDIRRTRRR